MWHFSKTLGYNQRLPLGLKFHWTLALTCVKIAQHDIHTTKSYWGLQVSVHACIVGQFPTCSGPPSTIPLAKPQRGRGEYSVHSKLYTFKFYIHTTQYKHHLYKSLTATTPLPPPPPWCMVHVWQLQKKFIT